MFTVRTSANEDGVIGVFQLGDNETHVSIELSNLSSGNMSFLSCALTIAGHKALLENNGALPSTEQIKAQLRPAISATGAVMSNVADWGKLLPLLR